MMRYGWYQRAWPKDRFLGQWDEYDLWHDSEDGILSAVHGLDEDDLESIELSMWKHLDEDVYGERHREALREAHQLMSAPDPSVSPKCLRKKVS